ncbi:MAG: glutathione S-transferase family protein [Pseudomonadota bacterium]
MNKKEFDAIVDAANAHLTNSFKNRVIGSDGGATPRFEVYHSAPSLCSHKVRTVLAEKQIPHVSHDMQIMPLGKAVPQNYRPSYVRMRLLGGEGKSFASGYTGASSVETQGFDPCVVPTLVDREKQRVIIDSSEICKYLENECDTGTRLVPEGMEAAIQTQIDIIDRSPHVAMLYGANPDGDVRPEGLRKGITGVQARKIVKLRQMMSEVREDPDVLAAYESKIAKEEGSADFVATPEKMRQAYAAMEAHADDLEQQLATHSGAWSMGEDFTMADVMWSVSLFRLKWIGLGYCWEQGGARPRVASYVDRAFKRPSFRSAVFDWPRAYGPSQHVPEKFTPQAKRRFFIDMVRGMNLREVFLG